MAGFNLGNFINMGSQFVQTAVGIGSKLVTGGTFKTLLDSAGKFVSNTAQLIMGGLQKIDFSNAASHILQIVNPERMANVTKLITDAGERLKNIVPTISNGLLSGNIGENLNQLLQNLGSFNPLNIVSGLTDKINSLRETFSIGDRKTLIDTTQLGNFGQFLTEKFNSIQERFTGFQNQMQELGISGIISQKLQESQSQLSGLFDQFKQQFPTLGNFLEQVTGQAEAVDQAIDQTQGDVISSETGHGQLEEMPSWFQNAELVDKNTGEKFGNVIGQYEDGSWLVEKPDGTTVAFDTSDNKYKDIELKDGSWDKATFEKTFDIQKEKNKQSGTPSSYTAYSKDKVDDKIVQLYDKDGELYGTVVGEYDNGSLRVVDSKGNYKNYTKDDLQKNYAIVDQSKIPDIMAEHVKYTAYPKTKVDKKTVQLYDKDGELYGTVVGEYENGARRVVDAKGNEKYYSKSEIDSNYTIVDQSKIPDIVASSQPTTAQNNNATKTETDKKPIIVKTWYGGKWVYPGDKDYEKYYEKQQKNNNKK